MAIQILGLRERIGKDGKKKKGISFFGKNWRAKSIPDLLNNIDEHIKVIPVEERFNLQFTIADCLEEFGRKMIAQDCIFFDIDEIDVSRAGDYIDAVCTGMGVPREYVSVVMTGHGLHVVMQFDKSWDSPDFYTKYREHYKAICMRINQELIKVPLVGFADNAVFADTRMVRLPQTINRKPNRKDVLVELIHNELKPFGGTFDSMVELGAEVKQEDQVAPQVVADHFQVDDEAVLSKCAFLTWARENQTEVREPEWYAVLSVVSRLNNGDQLAHDFSSEHPNYDKDVTDLKIEQSKATSGPRTCKNHCPPL
jgi:hypothetical protein